MVAISPLIALLCHAAALCGALPLFPWLSTVPRVLLLLGMGAGVWQALRGPWPLPNWTLNAAGLLFFLYYGLLFSQSSALQPVVNVLAVMLALRLVGEKNGRHYLQILALSLFCLAATSLFDLSPLFLLYLALLLLVVAVTLVLLTFYQQESGMRLSRRDLRTVLLAGMLLLAASLPLTLFFFPLLPRTQIPLWDISGAPLARTSGFSERVEPGLSPEAPPSTIPAFRAELPRLPERQLYWRGTVFNRFDGSRWIREGEVPAERLLQGGKRMAQVIYPEPGFSRFLVCLDVPVSVSAFRARTNRDATVELAYRGGRRLSYRAESTLDGLLAVAGGIDRDFYLRLPPQIPERISALAGRIRRQGGSDEARVELLEQFFRNGGYRYSRQELPTGPRALERFLFDGKQGHCEFFASSFALLARAAGVPARLVGGYLGGEYNDVGGYYLVSEGMAHVWVELFITGKGWLRLDPSSLARNADQLWRSPRGKSLALRLRMTLDSLDHAWNRSVISYDFERQADAVRSAGRRLQGVSLPRLSRGAALYGVPAALLLLAALAVWKRGAPLPGREERLLRAFHRQLERECGVKVRPGRQGLFELARLSGSPRAEEFAAIYAGALYRDRKLTGGEYARLRRILREGLAA